VAGGVEEGDGRGVVAGTYDPAADRWRMLACISRLDGGRGHLQARTAMWAGTRLLM
jgi:hypothetical protein